MGFSCGIVGLPNAGKSTLFNGLMRRVVAEASNYPFCTIEPHRGQVAVHDERLDMLARISHSKQTIPAMMEVVDIAGLVRGASKGEGLGNLFLSHIREVHAIAHVVRCYESTDITHVEQSTDPGRDIEIINTELMLADLASCELMLAKMKKTHDKETKVRKDLLDKIHACLARGAPVRSLDFDEHERVMLKSFSFLTLKPVLYVANVAEEMDESLVRAVEAQAEKEKCAVLCVPCGLEGEIATLSEEEQESYRKALGFGEASLRRFVQKGYELLSLKNFFTSGVKETRAWACHQKALAPQAAGVIHGDFARGFIAAEVVSYEDFITCEGWEGAKKNGKWRLEGRDYCVQDGDVILFRFNV